MRALSRVIEAYRRLGRTDRVLAIIVLATGVLSFLPFFRLAFLLLFTWGALRLIRRHVRKAIWRLRNRLIVAYMFIAVVPVLLITALAAIVMYAYTGQIAVYLVTSELDRRASQLRGMAQHLDRITPREREEWVSTGAGFLRDHFPGLMMYVTGPHPWAFPPGGAPERPAEGWGEASGVLVKGEFLYLWAHVVQGAREVTVLLPLTHELLGEMAPNLGEVSFVPLSEDGGARKLRISRLPGTDPALRGMHNRVLDPYNRADREVVWGTPILVSVWDSKGVSENQLLRLRTRPSAVLQTIFTQKIETFQGAISIAFGAVAIGFLIAEIISLLIGTTITRTITTAVHGLYGGTECVMRGDFSHRIEVKSNDQLGELSRSFNNMTENIERLLEISKEKERLQSEIEIAREVQNQLFPKTTPALTGLRLTAHCNPARMVSGDYYDYQSLDDTRVALAVGDVAGKGISAALLMATVQATLRTQIRACLEQAVAAGYGGSHTTTVSTSKLVSQLNQQLYAHTSPEKFATFYFGVYDDASSWLTYTNAGHLPPILFHNGSVARLEVNGMVVGAFPFADYEESRVQLRPGDLLVCFTDGITEPENEYGEMFGEDRLIEVIGRNLNRGSEEIVEAVMQAVRSWTGSPELQDDMTLLLARRQ